MKKRVTKILTKFVVDVYHPVEVSGETIETLPRIKYYRGNVCFVPTKEAARYIAEGSAIKGTQQMRKEFREAIITGINIAVQRMVQRIKVAIALDDEAYFANLRRHDKWQEHIENLLKREPFTAVEKRYLGNMLKKTSA